MDQFLRTLVCFISSIFVLSGVAILLITLFFNSYTFIPDTPESNSFIIGYTVLMPLVIILVSVISTLFIVGYFATNNHLAPTIVGIALSILLISRLSPIGLLMLEIKEYLWIFFSIISLATGIGIMKLTSAKLFSKQETE